MNLNVEQRIKLNFEPKPYQYELFHAVENLNYKKIIYVGPRRAGKDYSGFHIALREIFLSPKPISVFHCLPSFSQGRRVIWDGLTHEGTNLIESIPRELVESRNSSLMRVQFKTGSRYHVVGSDSFHSSLVGTNPSLIIFSEFSRALPEAYAYARPILAANGGKVIFLSTPYGRNHFYDLYCMAKERPDWYVIHQKTSEINHIPEEVLEEERFQMSEELYMQEYECSFERGVEGSIFGKIIDKLYTQGQVGFVSYDPDSPVSTAWDIGINDNTVIIFFQSINHGRQINILETYSNRNENIEFYIKYIRSKSYVYDSHYLPHDAVKREFGTGRSVINTARSLGFNPTLIPRGSLWGGIDKARVILPRCFFDERNNKILLQALTNYHLSFSSKYQCYSNDPVHDWSSHFADALRTLAMAVDKGSTIVKSPRELQEIRNRALYGMGNKFIGPNWTRR